MEKAGAAAWQSLRAAWPDAGRITVICGAGNNAGDGYILARLALEENCKVRVLTLVEPSQLKGDAGAAAEKVGIGHGVGYNPYRQRM